MTFRTRWLAIAGVLVLSACARHNAAGPWQAVQVPTDADFAGIWFTDSLNGWLTGGGWAIDGGIAGRTRDGGRTWRFESGILGAGDDRAALGRVQFRDSLHGCVTTGRGDVVVTDDGGTHWRPVPISGPSGTLFDVQFLNAWKGWAGGTRIASTEDGGETWRTLVRSTNDNGYLSANAIHFVDADRGWLAGHTATFMQTFDGGASWTPVPLPLRAGEHPTFWDLTFVGAEQGWVVGDAGTIFHTNDGGVTWTRQEQGVPIVRVIPKGEPPRPREVVPELEIPPDRLTLAAIRFADARRGWAVGYYADVAESVVLRTDDGGASWRVEHVQPGEELRSLFVLDAGHAWAAGDRARTRPQVVLRYAAVP